jgi:hypothetical protein
VDRLWHLLCKLRQEVGDYDDAGKRRLSPIGHSCNL